MFSRFKNVFKRKNRTSVNITEIGVSKADMYNSRPSNEELTIDCGAGMRLKEKLKLLSNEGINTSQLVDLAKHYFSVIEDIPFLKGIIDQMLIHLNTNIVGNNFITGMTPLLAASIDGNVEKVKLLLDKGADVNQSMSTEIDPAIFSGLTGNTDIIKVMLKYAANNGIFLLPQWNALKFASFLGNVEMVKLLLEHKAEVNQATNNDCDSLMYACLTRNTQVVQLLLENGANVRYANNLGINALIVASLQGDMNIITLLLEYKADCNQHDVFRMDSLMYACNAGHTMVVKLFLSRGGSFETVNNEGLNALMIASKKGHFDVVKLLLKYKANVNHSYKNGCDSLMRACAAGHKQVVELLIKNGANFRNVDKDGMNALLLASNNGRSDIVELLLLLGADVNATNSMEQNSLMLSSKEGHADVVELLLNFGADFTNFDNSGHDALEIALINYQFNIVEILLKERCKRISYYSCDTSNFDAAFIEVEAINIMRLGFISFRLGQLTQIKKLEEYFVKQFTPLMSSRDVKLVCNVFKIMAHLLPLDSKQHAEDTGYSIGLLSTEIIIALGMHAIDVESRADDMRYFNWNPANSLKDKCNQIPTNEELLEIVSKTTNILMKQCSQLKFFIYHEYLYLICSEVIGNRQETIAEFFNLLLERNYIESTIQFIKESKLFKKTAPGFSVFLVRRIFFLFFLASANCIRFSLRLAECGLLNLIVDFFALNKSLQDKWIVTDISLIILRLVTSKDGMGYVISSNILHAMTEYIQPSSVCSLALLNINMFMQFISSGANSEEDDIIMHKKIPELFNGMLKYLLRSRKKEKLQFEEDVWKLLLKPPNFDQLESVVSRISDPNNMLDAFGDQFVIGDTEIFNKALSENIYSTLFTQFLSTFTNDVDSNPWTWILSKWFGKLPRQNGKMYSPDFPKEFIIEANILGQGAFGSVHLVRDSKHPDDQKFVAKKIHRVDKESFNIFEKEAAILLKTRHRRIIRFHGYQSEEDGLYIFLEFAEMRTLAFFINLKKHLDETTARRITIQILDGLLYLHQNNILHRDIKGSNILMVGDLNIKITDFGISELTDGKGVSTQVGTMTHMAPEVWYTEGNKIFKYTSKSDIWSVGCTVVEMLTGKPPNSSLLPAQIAFRTRAKMPLVYELPESTSLELKEFLKKTLQWDAHLRPSADWLLTNDPFVLPKEGDVVYSKLSNSVDFFDIMD